MANFIEKFEKHDRSTIDSAFNESMYALRRQDRILSEINRLAVDVSQGKLDSLMPYLALLERFYMELSVIYADQWEEEIEERGGIIFKKYKRPEDLRYVESVIADLTNKATKIAEDGKMTENERFIFGQLKTLELYLRRLKQKHGMGVKREEAIDDEQRLAEAFGL